MGVLAIALLLVACVPEPADRATPTHSDAAAVATATPVPTPAGPTPTPSFVRPTATPQPTFLAYIVVTGDNLEKIARRFGTSQKSIAYWNRVTYPTLDPDSGTYRPDYVKVGWRLLLRPHAEVDPEDLPTLPPPPGSTGSDPPSEAPAGD
jgi:hypothetical protein